MNTVLERKPGNGYYNGKHKHKKLFFACVFINSYVLKPV